MQTRSNATPATNRRKRATSTADIVKTKKKTRMEDSGDNEGKTGGKRAGKKAGKKATKGKAR